MKRICLFVRVSTEKQDYDRQIYELTKYCEERNFTITKTIATQISGRKERHLRPDIDELLTAANNDEFDSVLVTEINRLGRKAKDLRSTIDKLHSLKKSIVFKNLGGLESLDENYQESFVTNIIISIYTELAQEEVRILRERIKSGIVNFKQKGGIMGRKLYCEESPDKFLSKYTDILPEIFSLSIADLMAKHNLSKGTVVKIRKTYRKQQEKQTI
jgi:DNA invertase Pin-like site-specific DNA recombinase